MERNMDHQLTPPHAGSFDIIKLEQKLKNGANWFMAIAALSLINSLITQFGGNWNFIIGLGITQIIDVIAVSIAAEVAANTATAVQVVSFVVVAAISGIFALFGVLGKKRSQWAFIIGIVFYTLDAVIFLFAGDMLSIGFHLFALFSLFNGLTALRKMNQLNT